MTNHDKEFAIKVPPKMVTAIKIQMTKHHPVMGLYKDKDPIFGINSLKVIRAIKAV